MEFNKTLVTLDPPETNVVTSVYWNNLLAELRDGINGAQEYLSSLSEVFNQEIDSIVSQVVEDINNGALAIYGSNVEVLFNGEIMDLNMALESMEEATNIHNELEGIKSATMITSLEEANHSSNDIWDATTTGGLQCLTETINALRSGLTILQGQVSTKADKVHNQAIGYGMTSTPSGSRMDGEPFRNGDLWVQYE